MRINRVKLITEMAKQEISVVQLNEITGVSKTTICAVRKGKTCNQRTAEKIANDFFVGRETVKRAEHFVDGLDSAEKVSPGFRDSILTGEVKAPKEVIREIRNISEEKRTAAVEAIKSGNIAGAKEIIKKL